MFPTVASVATPTPTPTTSVGLPSNLILSYMGDLAIGQTRSFEISMDIRLTLAWTKADVFDSMQHLLP